MDKVDALFEHLKAKKKIPPNFFLKCEYQSRFRNFRGKFLKRFIKCRKIRPPCPLVHFFHFNGVITRFISL